MDEAVNELVTHFKPLVSIIIPCYNLDGYLDNCLNSCILQSYLNLEIIAINDGSKDGTGRTINDYAGIDNRIIPLHLQNGGVAKARRIAISKSSGQYFFFLDGDDSMPLNAIERLVDAAEKSGSDIVVGNLFWEKNNGFELNENPHIGKIDSLGFLKRLVGERDFSMGAKLYARKLFTNDLNYHEDLKRGEDALLSMQLIHKANSVYGIADVTYYYRNRLASISRTTNPNTCYYHQVFVARFKVEEYALAYGVKATDFELSKYICFAIVVYLTNTKRTILGKSLVKQKIRDYLITNTEFQKYYKAKFEKNYYRLYMYYYLSLSHKLFVAFYKLFKMRMINLKTNPIKASRQLIRVLAK